MNNEDLIHIYCICNTSYFSERGRFHICPNCKHKWDISPQLDNKPELKLDNEKLKKLIKDINYGK